MKPYQFPDPSRHPEWTPPQSEAFYSRLVEETGEYKYPWNSIFEEPTAETILYRTICSNLSEQARILDVGCGHGEFTHRVASNARAAEVIGIDITEGFIHTANRSRGSGKVRYQQVNADADLPFADHEFDAAYTKKGPTGWYQEANRVVKPGGLVCGLYHGGTDGGLRKLFPGLYVPMVYEPDKAAEGLVRNLRLSDSGLADIQVQPIEEIEYLAAPEDVLRKKCFGQSKLLKEFVWRECLQQVEEIFHHHATSKGLKVINYHYFVTAKARTA
ncbi:class I SAM-dependent methyltransferase [Paenibacillus spongiae]|uniref:Methyltransferase domain-containing protein n=1 Tax=Paenibacillus spongiae TaxID=2909671 RepID=A0ABY5SHC4_9BACL|nr:class I SAM-dependent methyltransferase [Paenibacillus spongiae]UVI33059.1 methyltransferase domain-containing protein [Paenibacillus spongiae]